MPPSASPPLLQQQRYGRAMRPRWPQGRTCGVAGEVEALQQLDGFLCEQAAAHREPAARCTACTACATEAGGG